MSDPVPDASVGSEPTGPRGAIGRFDAAVDGAFDHLRGNPLADRVFYTASQLGDFSLIWHLLGAVQGVRRDGDLAGTARLAIALGVESAIVNGPVKSAFRRERPRTEVERPMHLRTPKTSSFPSGHASAATVFALLAGRDDPWRPAYLGAAAIVATSRIHVRIHHASDVIGGVVAGAALAAAFGRIWPARRSGPEPRSRG